jgi:hypothetical protein
VDAAVASAEAAWRLLRRAEAAWLLLHRDRGGAAVAPHRSGWEREGEGWERGRGLGDGERVAAEWLREGGVEKS